MRINAHAHIFTLNTVLSRHAVSVIAGRVRQVGLPDFVADAVESFLAEQAARPEFLTEEELLRRLLDLIRRTPGFRDLLHAPDLPIEVRMLGGGLPAVGASALRSTLDRLSSRFDDRGTSKTTIANIFETLRLAMQPDLVSVADRLLEPITDGANGSQAQESGLVALMMDITSHETLDADRPLFLSQLKATSDAAVARPGRIFPFVAVNTRRADYRDLMRRGIEELGCVGVKLYPSLDSKPTATKVLSICNYCRDNDVPILLHCNQGGFYESADKTDNCNPEHWREILRDRPGLRVCFAHSGGLTQGQLKPNGPEPGDWAHTIVDLMESFDEVYTDLSFHVDQMATPEATDRYLGWLRGLLARPTLRDRVLLGTDGWLVRMRLSEAHFWRWFETHLTPVELRTVAEAAPARFLGLPDANGQGMRPNIRRMVDFLKAQPAVGDEPATWVRQAAGTTFTVQRRNPGWTPNNHAHFITHRFFRSQFMTAPQKSLGFEEAGALRLRQLTYWNKEQVSPARFREDCEAVALRLVSLCRGSGGLFEGNFGDDAAVHRLADVAADGEKRLAEAGAAVDAIFRFSTELA